MARLKGWLKAAKGTQYTMVSRLSDDHITYSSHTWNSEVELTHKRDGSFYVTLNGQRIVEGNTDRNEAYAGPAMSLNAAGGGGEFTPLRDVLAKVEDAVSEYREIVNGN
jgi:hypothetical protein